MKYTDYINTKHDKELSEICGLKWLPWVGLRYETKRTCPKLLIIGESHYAKANGNETVEEVCVRHEADVNFTREILWEDLTSDKAEISTYKNIPRLFFGDASYKKLDFWQDIAFINLVQRMMLLKERPERPSWDTDYVDGWSVFYEVLNILRPDYCIFMGTEAHHRFWFSMNKRQVKFSDVKKTEKIGRYWGYNAEVTIDSKPIPLEFVRHPGSFFSAPAWHAYIIRRFPEQIAAVTKEYRF